jgi:hypothetical protein
MQLVVGSLMGLGCGKKGIRAARHVKIGPP